MRIVALLSPHVTDEQTEATGVESLSQGKQPIRGGAGIHAQGVRL